MHLFCACHSPIFAREDTDPFLNFWSAVVRVRVKGKTEG